MTDEKLAEKYHEMLSLLAQTLRFMADQLDADIDIVASGGDAWGGLPVPAGDSPASVGPHHGAAAAVDKPADVAGTDEPAGIDAGQ